MPLYRTGMRSFALSLLVFAVFASPLVAAPSPSLEKILSYPYVSGLVASPNGNRFAWVENVRGVRNLWSARANDNVPRRLTNYSLDDGQELTNLVFSSDEAQLLYVRGGDHDANWQAEGKLAPNPANSPSEEKVTIWSVSVTDVASTPVSIAEGDAPVLSVKGQLAFVKDGQIWSAKLPVGRKPAGKPERLFFDRGHDARPTWSPDGTRLAFVSDRGDHSFVGVFTSAEKPLVYLAPSTNYDGDPVWSPDGASIAFMRHPSQGDVLQNFLVQQPNPFAIWIADASTGKSRRLWSSPDTLAGSVPNLSEEEPLFWMGNHIVFLAEMDNWPHLYAVSTVGGEARLLTPGTFMVENLTQALDDRSLVYSANTGGAAGDEDRRHLFRVGIDGEAPVALSHGDALEWSPVALAEGKVAYVSAGAQQPPVVRVLAQADNSRELATGSGKDYPSAALVVPKPVTFTSPDGLTIHGQLFRQDSATGLQRGVIFVHGGPLRQMLLGWHYRDYYSNAYAVNQYLAAQGFTVLSVNYRLGIGYGRTFQHPEHAGEAGASEYQDVLAGAHYLQQVAGVDPHRIGIWGGSYGGYLTGLGLARNSDVFKAGVDFHGISNWIPLLAKDQALPEHWYEATADWQKAIATAFAASPDADIATWKSPVLLVQGDDDRNVLFDQTVELAHRLEQQNTPCEELVIPNEIHGFLRWSNWLQADGATVEFLERQLAQGSSDSPDK
jgi:dipeptidyl aminopeptidase/acylaminoacyl peptidase